MYWPTPHAVKLYRAIRLTLWVKGISWQEFFYLLGTNPLKICSMAGAQPVQFLPMKHRLSGSVVPDSILSSFPKHAKKMKARCHLKTSAGLLFSGFWVARKGWKRSRLRRRSGQKSPGFETKFSIYIEDTDCFGVVFYANYFRFFQRALNEMTGGQSVIVGAKEARYRSAAKLGDVLTVQLWLEEDSCQDLSSVAKAGRQPGTSGFLGFLSDQVQSQTFVCVFFERLNVLSFKVSVPNFLSSLQYLTYNTLFTDYF